MADLARALTTDDDREEPLLVVRLGVPAERSPADLEAGRRWAEENREGIAAYNAYIEREGLFGDDLRLW